jgi:hypothetical protein
MTFFTTNDTEGHARSASHTIARISRSAAAAPASSSSHNQRKPIASKRKHDNPQANLHEFVKFEE